MKRHYPMVESHAPSVARVSRKLHYDARQLATLRTLGKYRCRQRRYVAQAAHDVDMWLNEFPFALLRACNDFEKGCPT